MMLPLDDKMLAETFPDGLCLTPIEHQDPHGLSNKDEFIEHHPSQSLTAVADVSCLARSNDHHVVSSHDTIKRLPTYVSSNRGRVRWTNSDTLILIGAKQLEKNLQSTDGSWKRTKFSLEKWKVIAAHCQKNGLNRTATQCRDRWEHILPDYKKISHYERNVASGHDSYWNMTPKERMDNKLPTNYTKEIYEAMEKYFGQDFGCSSADMIIDTSASDLRTFDDYHFSMKCSPLHDNASLESQLESPSDSSLDKDDQNTRKKQKLGLDNIGIINSLTNYNKVAISNLKETEEGQMKRHERYCNMYERRMKMDEKYLNHNAMMVQRMVNIEEQKVKVQCDIVAALHNIGEAMLKICDSIDRNG